jgi:cell wall-associated NlpC family hydrolase
MVFSQDRATTLRKSASAMHLLEYNQHLLTLDPKPGDLVIWDHGKGLGHVGILTGTTHINGTLTSIDVIAGNTSEDGKSRNGDRVAEHPCTLELIAGYLRVCSQKQ